VIDYKYLLILLGASLIFFFIGRRTKSRPKTNTTENVVLVDTSALIDGRI